jgi:hypothetical protein
MFKTLIFISTISLTIISCKKQEILDKTPFVEKLTNNSAKAWKYIASMTDGKNDLGTCNNDDRLIFNNLNAKLLIDRGAQKCITNEANQEFSYSFSAGGKIISIDKESYDILIFTKKTLKLKSRVADHGDGDQHNHNYEITLEAL